MATTVPPHLAPRQPPPPAPAPAAALTESPYARSCAAAAPDKNARKESVAESCCPTSESVIDADGSGSDDEQEEDGCESCVEGSEGGEEKDEERSEDVVWSWSQDVVWSWSQDGSGGCFIWPPNRSDRTTTPGCGHAGAESDDDSKAAAARRQEEDRKFWEACLSSGYP